MTPRRRTELHGVVVRHAGEPEPVVGELVPLLARDLARLAPDAHRRVGEEALRAHRERLPGRMSAVRAFDSWIDTFGSATKEMSSFAASPRAMPVLPQ